MRTSLADRLERAALAGFVVGAVYFIQVTVYADSGRAYHMRPMHEEMFLSAALAVGVSLVIALAPRRGYGLLWIGLAFLYWAGLGPFVPWQIGGPPPPLFNRLAIVLPELFTGWQMVAAPLLLATWLALFRDDRATLTTGICLAVGWSVVYGWAYAMWRYDYVPVLPWLLTGGVSIALYGLVVPLTVLWLAAQAIGVRRLSAVDAAT